MKKRAAIIPIKGSIEEKTTELKVQKLLSKDFSEALNKLCRFPMRPNASMKAKRGALLIACAVKNYIEKRIEIMEEYADKDAEGNALSEGDNYKISDENAKKALVFLEKQLEMVVFVPVIHVGELSGDVLLTPEFLLILDGIIIDDVK